MAAYHRVDDLTVTCGVTVCTLGSAPGPTLGIEYGKAFTFTFPYKTLTKDGSFIKTWAEYQHSVLNDATDGSGKDPEECVNVDHF